MSELRHHTPQLPSLSELRKDHFQVQCIPPGAVNGVYSLKWRLTDMYLRWGTLADSRPGWCHADQCKSSEFLHELRNLGFPALLSVPHLLAREIIMNRRHWFSDVTGCMKFRCIQWHQRTNFTAPGCTPSLSSTYALLLYPISSFGRPALDVKQSARLATFIKI